MDFYDWKDLYSVVFIILFCIFMWNGAHINAPINSNAEKPSITETAGSDESSNDEYNSEEPAETLDAVAETGVADWDTSSDDTDENEEIDDASSKMLSASNASFKDTGDFLEAFGKTKVETGIFNVKITFDAAMFDSSEKPITQEYLDSSINNGSPYKSAKLNDDGSVSFIMSKSKHNALLKSLRKEAEKSFEKLTVSDNNAFKEIKFNEDMTEYKAYLDSDTIGFNGFSAITFYLYSGFYGIMSGKPVDDVTIEWINANTNEVIETTHSKDANKKNDKDENDDSSAKGDNE